MESASRTTTLPLPQTRADGAPRTLPVNSVLGGYVLREFIEHDGCIAAYRGHAVLSGQDVIIWELFPTRVVTRGRDLNLVPHPQRAALWVQNLAAYRSIGKALLKVRHDNLIPAIDFIEARGTGYLVSRWDQDERLDARHTRLGGFSDLVLADLAIGILAALQRLHSCGLAHGDMHEKNVHHRDDSTPMLGYSLRGLTGNLNRLITCAASSGDEHFPNDASLAHEQLKDLQAFSAMLSRNAGIRKNDRVTEPDQLLWRSQSLLSLIAKPAGARIEDQNVKLTAEQWQQDFERLRERVLIPQAQGQPPPPLAIANSEPRVVALNGAQSAAEPQHAKFEESIPPTVPNHVEALPRFASTAKHKRGLLVGLAVVCLTLIAIALWQHVNSKTGTQSSTAVVAKNSVPDSTSENQLPVVPAPELHASTAPPSEVVGDHGAEVKSEGAHEMTSNAAAPSAVESPSQQVPAEQSTPNANSDVSGLLTAAQADLDARRLTLPFGNNAVEKYRAALKLEPNNAEARSGLQRVGAILLKRAEKQLAAGEFDAVAESLQRARTIVPGSSKIAALEKSLAERKQLAQTPRTPQPYPPVFKSPPPPAPAKVVAPPVIEEATRAEQLRQRLGGIQ